MGRCSRRSSRGARGREKGVTHTYPPRPHMPTSPPPNSHPACPACPACTGSLPAHQTVTRTPQLQATGVWELGKQAGVQQQVQHEGVADAGQQQLRSDSRARNRGERRGEVEGHGQGNMPSQHPARTPARAWQHCWNRRSMLLPPLPQPTIYLPGRAAQRGGRGVVVQGLCCGHARHAARAGCSTRQWGGQRCFSDVCRVP